MSDPAPPARAGPRWAIVAFAVVLGFVMLVVMHGLPVTPELISIWLVASAVGVALFCAAEAVRRRRGRRSGR